MHTYFLLFNFFINSYWSNFFCVSVGNHIGAASLPPVAPHHPRWLHLPDRCWAGGKNSEGDWFEQEKSEGEKSSRKEKKRIVERRRKYVTRKVSRKSSNLVFRNSYLLSISAVPYWKKRERCKRVWDQKKRS